MCTTGVNTSQLKSTIEQIDEAVALTRRWTHRSFHLADDAGQAKTAAKLQAAQSLLDEVRAVLSEATDIIDSEVDSDTGVTVSLV